MKRILTWVLVGAILALPLAAAGIAVTERFYTTVGTKKMVTARVTFDSAYAAGGEALTAATLGLSKVEWAIVSPDSIGADATGAGPFSIGYDALNGTIFVCGLEDTLTGAAGSANFEEMDAGTDLSTLKVRIMAFGN